MSLIYFATQSYIAYRVKGMPKEVAFFKAHMETMKFRIVSAHKENEIPTEQDIKDLQYIANDNRFTQNAEFQYKQIVNKSNSKLRVLN